MATGDLHKKIHEDRSSDSRDTPADTDRQADHNTLHPTMVE